MSEFSGVLIYDGDCPLCSAAASALRRLPDVGSVAWESDAAGAFLDAQFGDRPFALVFVDGADGTVYVGREAARELCERAGVPALVQDVVGENYERMADAIRTVAGVDREPDPYHGVYPLAADAEPAFEALADAASSATRHLE